MRLALPALMSATLLSACAIPAGPNTGTPQSPETLAAQTELFEDRRNELDQLAFPPREPDNTRRDGLIETNETDLQRAVREGEANRDQ